MAQRKTTAERRQEWEAVERRTWDDFRRKLAGLLSFAEAKQLVERTPSGNFPGRRYYSNLGFFLMAFRVPGGADEEERALYLEFVRRLDAAGELKPGALEEIEKGFPNT